MGIMLFIVVIVLMSIDIELANIRRAIERTNNDTHHNAGDGKGDNPND